MVRALRRWTNLPLDVHLMIEQPKHHIRDFAEAGADIITVHAEACRHLHQAIQMVKGHGVKVGVALNPGTPLSQIEEVLTYLDLVLLMTVNPGFGGQAFIEDMIDKIARLRHCLDEKGLGVELEVDGGINADLAPRAIQAGARVLVAGSAVFNSSESITKALQRIRVSLG